MNDWRKTAEYKVEDLRQLLIKLDFAVQQDGATSCRSIISEIEAKTLEIRVLLASR